MRPTASGVRRRSRPSPRSSRTETPAPEQTATLRMVRDLHAPLLVDVAATREQRHRPGRSSRDTPTRSNHPTAGAGYADADGLGSLHAQATRTAPQQTHPACSGCAASDRPVPGSRRPTTYESCSRRASFLWLSRESIPFRAHASV